MASDGILTDNEIVSITVNESGNQPPLLAPVGPQTTTENVALAFAVNASDPDGTFPVLSSSTLPFGATFVDDIIRVIRSIVELTVITYLVII